MELENLPDQNVHTYSGFRRAAVIAVVLAAIVLSGLALFVA